MGSIEQCLSFSSTSFQLLPTFRPFLTLQIATEQLPILPDESEDFGLKRHMRRGYADEYGDDEEEEEEEEEKGRGGGGGRGAGSMRSVGSDDDGLSSEGHAVGAGAADEFDDETPMMMMDQAMSRLSDPSGFAGTAGVGGPGGDEGLDVGVGGGAAGGGGGMASDGPGPQQQEQQQEELDLGHMSSGSGAIPSFAIPSASSLADAPGAIGGLFGRASEGSFGGGAGDSFGGSSIGLLRGMFGDATGSGGGAVGGFDFPGASNPAVSPAGAPEPTTGLSHAQPPYSPEAVFQSPLLDHAGLVDPNGSLPWSPPPPPPLS